MDIRRREELAKEKRIEKLIRNEELEEAMNKLPINERAIIKEALIKIKSDNHRHRMFLDDKLARERDEKISEFRRERDEREKRDERENERRECSLMMNVCIMCAGAVGTVAYVGLALMK